MAFPSREMAVQAGPEEPEAPGASARTAPQVVLAAQAAQRLQALLAPLAAMVAQATTEMPVTLAAPVKTAPLVEMEQPD